MCVFSLCDVPRFVFVLCFVVVECVPVLFNMSVCFVCNVFSDVVCCLSVWLVLVACFMPLCVIFVLYSVKLSGVSCCVFFSV